MYVVIKLTFFMLNAGEKRNTGPVFELIFKQIKTLACVILHKSLWKEVIFISLFVIIIHVYILNSTLSTSHREK